MPNPRAHSAPAAIRDARVRPRPRPRSEGPRAFRRIAAALTTLVLGAGLAIAAAAAPASAHHNTITGVGICHADSSTFDITWTVVNSENKPEQVIVSSNESVVPVGTELGETESATFTEYGVEAGTYELKLTTEWSNGLRNTDAGTVTVAGDCGDGAVRKITFCHATGSESNPYVRLTTSVRAFFHAGHIDHHDDGDVYPEFSYATKDETLTVPEHGDQALLQFEDCAESSAPADPTVPAVLPLFTEVDVPAKPGIRDVCGVDGDLILPPAETTGVTWKVSSVVNGSATATATAEPGFVFPDGTTDTSWSFEFDSTPCAGPSLAGSTVTGICRADAPWIVYDIVLTDADGQATGGSASLLFTDGQNSEIIELGTLDENGALQGTVLWPGASVAEDGVTPIGWPGWEQVDGEWVETDGNFAWTRDVTTATLVVNPDLEFAITYPVATSDCIAAPRPVVDQGGEGTALSGAGLASTGFAGTTIAIIAGIIVVAGLAFLVIARVRRNRS